MPGPDDIPEILRQRVMRQRRKLRFVRISLGVTAALSVILFVVAGQSTSTSPTARNILLLPQANEANELLMLDQQFEVAGQEGRQGSFGVAILRGDELLRGNRYNGIAHSFVRISDTAAGAVTSSAFLRFDLAAKDFPVVERTTLGLNDAGAQPSVVNAGGTLWLCWIHGNELKVRPLEQPDILPRTVHKAASPLGGLEATVSGDEIWTLLHEPRTQTLTLVAFTARIEKPVGTKPDDDADAGADVAAAEVAGSTAIIARLRSEVSTTARGGTLCVLGSGEAATPVVAYAHKDDPTRVWRFKTWSRKAGGWVDGGEPPKKSDSSLEVSSFITLLERKGNVLAVFSDGAEVRSATGTVSDEGALAWDTPVAVPLDATRGLASMAVWLAVAVGLMMLMGVQSVWLMLNRERPLDRTIVKLLENRGQDGQAKPKAKAEPKFLYASIFARVLALLIDLAITSPVVIVLQKVYEYTWSEAYGFLALLTFQPLDASILDVIRATLVTLLVLTIYGAICEQFWGRTFGKTLLRLRVVDAKGEAPAGWRIAVRNLLKVFELVHWVVFFIPMACMLIGGKQQRLGDWLAGTFVIVDAVPEETPDDIDI